jgi:ssDNA-binding Zn-finger/Zn-ribbon topoisomerase 1
MFECANCGKKMKIFFRKSDNKPFLGCGNFGVDENCRSNPQPMKGMPEYDCFLDMVSTARSRKKWWNRWHLPNPGTMCIVNRDLVFSERNKTTIYRGSWQDGDEIISEGTHVELIGSFDASKFDEINNEWPKELVQYRIVGSEKEFVTNRPGHSKLAAIRFLR